MGRWSIVVVVLLGAASCTKRNPALLTDAGNDRLVSDGAADWLPRGDRIGLPDRGRFDVPPTCGNGLCEPSKGESCKNCEKDCGPCAAVCGDGVCSPGETCQSCPKDCQSCCGNGKCDSTLGEDCATCPKDCGSCCGNGKCEFSLGETCTSCQKDCGSCPVSCKDLENQYLVALQQAKACTPMVPVLQCETLVDNKIACGCQTHVNAAQKAAITQMQTVQAQYAAQKCQTVPCLPVPCPNPGYGLCMPSTNGGGSCIDKTP